MHTASHASPQDAERSSSARSNQSEIRRRISAHRHSVCGQTQSCHPDHISREGNAYCEPSEPTGCHTKDGRRSSSARSNQSEIRRVLPLYPASLLTDQQTLACHFRGRLEPHHIEERGCNIRQDPITNIVALMIVGHINGVHQIGRMGRMW